MKKVKSKDTKEEISFRKELWKRGIRYRINYKKLSGSPDIVLTKYRIAIFIDGEFWHGDDWIKKRERIKDNRGYWIPKIERNMERDTEVNEKLAKEGYKVFRFWSRQVNQELGRCVSIILDYIKLKLI
jgi:DNA mismatch endonuclease (patch repair protein)